MSEPAETRDREAHVRHASSTCTTRSARRTREALFDELFALLAARSRRSWRSDRGPARRRGTSLARGARVHAVEISPSMASRLRSNLPTERLRVSVGDFETIDLAGGERRRRLRGECVPLDLARGPARSARADPAPGRRPGDRRTLPGRLARGPGVLRRGAADLRAVRASARGSAGAARARDVEPTIAQAPSPRILASPTSRSIGGTGTRRTPRPSTGS